MNKPLVAAGAGVAFGLFLGALHFGSIGARTTCPLATPSPVAVQVVPPPAVKPPPAPCAHHVPPAESVSEETEPTASVDPLTAAQTAFVNGEYAEAIAIARSARRTNPVRAWRIIAAAGCQQRDVKIASEAYRHLDAPGRQYAVYACQRAGLANHGSQFIKMED